MPINYNKLRVDLFVFFLGIFGFIVLNPNILHIKLNQNKTPLDIIFDVFYIKSQIHSDHEMQLFTQNFIISILYYTSIFLIIIGLCLIILDFIDVKKTIT